jgi:hypothetical protein
MATRWLRFLICFAALWSIFACASTVPHGTYHLDWRIEVVEPEKMPAGYAALTNYRRVWDADTGEWFIVGKTRCLDSGPLADELVSMIKGEKASGGPVLDW